MSKALESGKSFVQQVADRLPEAARAAFLAQFDGQDAALQFIGDGALARPEFSRQMAELQRIETEQTAWWNANRPLLELGQKAKTAGFDPASPGGNNPNPDGGAPVGITDEELNKRLNEREMGAAAFFSQLSTLSLRHYQQFGEVLDTDTLTRAAAADPNRRGLVAVYQEKYATQISAKAKELADADFNRRYQERRTEELKAERNRPPDTISAGPNAMVSPLDSLTRPANSGAEVQELVDMYNELAAKG